MPNEITNSAPRIITLEGGPRRGGVTLMPGETKEISDELLERIKISPAARGMFEAGHLINPTGELSGVPLPPKRSAGDKLREALEAARSDHKAPPKHVDKAPPAATLAEAKASGGVPGSVPEALKAIEACTDVPQLQAWFHAETRKGVRSALEARGNALLNPQPTTR